MRFEEDISGFAKSLNVSVQWDEEWNLPHISTTEQRYYKERKRFLDKKTAREV